VGKPLTILDARAEECIINKTPWKKGNNLQIEEYLRRRGRLVEKALERWVPGKDEFPPQVHKAMNYSLFAGGKRLRPILALAAAEAVGGRAADALPLACSLELIHTYSLIHDDLPSIDNDDLRRGKPTSHRVFGEGLAILAGDALLTEAFRLLARPDLMKNLSPATRLRVIYQVAHAAGSLGMVGGQVMDIACQAKKIDKPLLEYIHSHKTGALIAASVYAGGLVGGASLKEGRALSRYGQKLGLAFQITDDLLDIHGEPRKLGKSVRKDQAQGKATYPALFGLSESRRQAEALMSEAIDHLKFFDHRADPLREIARFILQRST
jgi:geranylgeranyl diphosphate synthase type II